MIWNQVKSWLLANMMFILLAIIIILGGVWGYQKVVSWNLRGQLEDVKEQNAKLSLQMTNIQLANQSLSKEIEKQGVAIKQTADTAVAWQRENGKAIAILRAENAKVQADAKTILSRQFDANKTACENADAQAALFGKGK